MKIGKKIKEIRKIKKMDQSTLATNCGISRTYLSQIENGKRNPNISILEKICNGLGVPFQVICFLSIDIGDVPKEKQLAYKKLNFPMTALIKAVFIPEL
ncbi:MAG: helix-turn-helix transcriptional regulator [Patescibacteria group bacterium]